MEKVYLNITCPCGVKGSIVLEGTKINCLSCDSTFKVMISEEGRPAILIVCFSHDPYRWPVSVCKVFTDTNEVSSWENPIELQPRQFVRGYIYAMNGVPLQKLVLFASRLKEQEIAQILSGWACGIKQLREGGQNNYEHGIERRHTKHFGVDRNRVADRVV